MKEICAGFIAEIRPTDWFQGDGNVVFQSNIPTGDWTPYFHFKEHQKFTWDDNGCVCFAYQKIVDAIIDWQISTGQVGIDVISHLTALGFMDAVNSDDGKPHFHSSARWIQSLTGNGFNGNPLPAAWDAGRHYGLLPWTDLPFDATITQAQYLVKPTQAQLDKAKQFSQYFTFSYHWIVDDGSLKGTPITKMKTALQQAPLQIGINVCNNWNQYVPTVCSDLSPQHSDAVMKMDTMTRIHDDYEPMLKSLPFAWNIGYCLQGMVNVVPQLPSPPPDAPVIAQNAPLSDVKPQVLGWLEVISQWLQNWLNSQKGRTSFGSIAINPFMSKILSLNSFDVVKGIIIAILAPVVQYIGQCLTAASGGGTFAPDWSAVAKLAFTAFVAYMGKQFLTNSQGAILQGE